MRPVSIASYGAWRRLASIRLQGRPGTALLFSLLVLVPARADEPNHVTGLENAITEWTKVRSETTRLESNWNSHRPFLESIVASATERADGAEATRNSLQAGSASRLEDEERLAAERKTARDKLGGEEAKLKAIDDDLVRLRPSLPPRLSDALQLPFEALASADLSLADRMQSTMTVLNRCVEFNRTITFDDEVVSVSKEGRPRLLEVLYWGLGHAYALDRSSHSAWYGSPGQDGWKWEALQDSSAPLVRLIDVYKGKSEPMLVEIPARLRNVGGATGKTTP
jgi:hypothetical protein